MRSDDFDLWNNDFWVFDFDISKLLKKSSTPLFHPEVANKSNSSPTIFMPCGGPDLNRKGGKGCLFYLNG